LAFSDTLRFEFGGLDGETSLFTNWEIPAEDIPDEKNLVLRAISLFREQTGYKKGLSVRLDKRIPTGSGLGGGSSDAAAALLAMNALSGSALPMQSLAAMASVLGSDVPFFLTGGAAFVSGRGETVEPVKSPGELCVVLVKPPFNSDTTHAYSLLDRLREQGIVKKMEKIPRETLLRALEGGSEEWPFFNDFMPVFLCKGYSANADMYGEILESLRGLGASFAGLSGSGSCCFGIFRSKAEAEKAAEKLRRNIVISTFFLARRADPVLK